MELNFLLLVIAALAGLTAKVVFGFDPYKLAGTLGFMILLLPMIGIGLEKDVPEVQGLASEYIERLINALPSMIIGEVAGVIAGTISDSIIRLFR